MAALLLLLGMKALNLACYSAQHGIEADPAAGLWVGDSFVYNNSAWRLNYCVGGEVSVMFHLDRPLYLLGYLASQSRVYLIDKVRPLPAALPAHLLASQHLSLSVPDYPR